jgi:phage FluMu protein Com
MGDKPVGTFGAKWRCKVCKHVNEFELPLYSTPQPAVTFTCEKCNKGTATVAPQAHLKGEESESSPHAVGSSELGIPAQGSATV